MSLSLSGFAPLLGADFTLLHFIPGFYELEQGFAAMLPKLPEASIPLYEPKVKGTLHLFLMALSAALVLLLALVTRASWGRSQNRAIPDGRFSIKELVESILDGLLSLTEQVFGDRKTALRFLPLLGTLALFIFFSNILAVIPMMAPPTDALTVTLAPALTVFLATHIWGIKANGMHHIMHLFGPPLITGPLTPLKAVLWIPALAFHLVFFVIELISHVARPASLSLRLAGNMYGDHLVLGSFMAMAAIPLLFPIPILFLGTLVSIVQTLVFVLLSTVYIAMAIEHSEEGH